MNETTPPPPPVRATPAGSEALLLQRPWTKKETAAYLGVSENTLDALIAHAGFPRPVLLGGKAALPRWWGPAVLAWWEQQATGEAGESPVPAAQRCEPPSAGSGRRVRPSGAGHGFGIPTREPGKARA